MKKEKKNNLTNEIVIHQKKEGIEYLQFRKLLEYQDDIKHAYSLGTQMNFRTKKIKEQSLKTENYSKAWQDYQKLCQAINLEETELVKGNQTHSNHVQIAKQKINANKPDFNLEIYKETDGLLTQEANLNLSITNADCILFLLYDPKTKVIGNIHSGWRGTVQRIVVEGIRKMKQEFNSQPEDIIIAICPSIRKCHFEVDSDVKEIVEEMCKHWSEKEQIITKQEGKEKWNIDTILLNRMLLQQEGIKPEHILDSGICSVCHSDKIHSYRVEKENYGLGTAIIGKVREGGF